MKEKIIPAAIAAIGAISLGMRPGLF